MRLSWAGKLLAAGLGLRAAAAGLRYLAGTLPDGEQVVLSEEQMQAAADFAAARGISIREAVHRLYNVILD